MKGEYTHEGLPVVSLEQYRSIGAELLHSAKFEKDEHSLLKKWFKEILAENPYIAKQIIDATSIFPPEHHAKVYLVLCETYQLLKKQGEANKLEKLLDEK